MKEANKAKDEKIIELEERKYEIEKQMHSNKAVLDLLSKMETERDFNIKDTVIDYMRKSDGVVCLTNFIFVLDQKVKSLQSENEEIRKRNSSTSKSNILDKMNSREFLSIIQDRDNSNNKNTNNDSDRRKRKINDVYRDREEAQDNKQVNISNTNGGFKPNTFDRNKLVNSFKTGSFNDNHGNKLSNIPTNNARNDFYPQTLTHVNKIQIGNTNSVNISVSNGFQMQKNSFLKK